MKRPLIFSFAATAALAGCATLTDVGVSGAPEAYRYIGERLLENKSEAQARQLIEQRPLIDRDDTVRLTVWETYVFVPVCNGSLVWEKRRARTVKPGLSIPLSC